MHLDLTLLIFISQPSFGILNVRKTFFLRSIIFSKFAGNLKPYRSGAGITFSTFNHICIDLQYTLDKVFCGFSCRSSSKTLSTRPIFVTSSPLFAGPGRLSYCFRIMFQTGGNRQPGFRQWDSWSYKFSVIAFQIGLFSQNRNFRKFQKILQICPPVKTLVPDGNRNNKVLSTRNNFKHAHVINLLGPLGTGFTRVPRDKP